jgi:hypothetical protein
MLTEMEEAVGSTRHGEVRSRGVLFETAAPFDAFVLQAAGKNAEPTPAATIFFKKSPPGNIAHVPAGIIPRFFPIPGHPAGLLL